MKTYESSILVSSTADEKYVYNYEYDSKGNISKVTICHLKVTYDTGGNVISSTKLDDDIIISYTYDHLNQLVCEHNETDKIISYYTYDSAGNIIGNQEYYYEETPDDLYLNEIKRYTYSTSDWGDLLTAFNGRSITYDAIGNPLSYYNVMHYAFTWEGRQLIRAEIEDDVYTFTYNDEGIRTSKTVNGVTTHYYLDGSQIVAEETEGNITVYLYDLNGSPLGFQYHKATDAADTWEIYWYEKNLHGDIISIYSDVDDNGNVNRLVNYTYDAWGNFYEEKLYTGVNEAIASNPYTYRGYYYDRDLWFYYLNSRYYDSYTGRFINADSALYHNSSFGYNLFAYCGNNSVNYVDYDGEVAEIVAACVSIAPYVIAAATLTAVVALMLIYIPKAVDIIMEAADSGSETSTDMVPTDSNKLPQEKEISVDMDHIMDRHHPSGGNYPNKSKFPNLTKRKIIEKKVREAYEDARKNFPDSVKNFKLQGGHGKYKLHGKNKAGKLIEIWFDAFEKAIKTAYPPWR